METLSYYGARFVGGDSNCNVTFQMTNRWALAASDKINQTQNCMCRQRMDDMTYSDDFFSKWVNRSGRGPTLEWIDSPNLDCPLSRYFDISSMSQLLLDIQNVKNWQFAKESSILVFISLFCKSHRNFFLSMGDSGHFVLARWTGDEKTEIEMTAFKVNVVHMI